MVSFFVTACLLGALRAGCAWAARLAGPEPKFEDYVRKFGRDYTPEEFQRRKELYTTRVASIQEHNSKSFRLWTAGVNHLTDRTPDELAALRNRRGVLEARAAGHSPMTAAQSDVFFASGDVDRKVINMEAAHSRLRGTSKNTSGTQYGCPLPENSTNLFNNKNESGDLPSSFSWAHQIPTLSDIRDQGTCGSCWAVTSSTVLWAHAQLKNLSRTFSTQELVDCVPNPDKCGGTGGCEGATVELAYDWVMHYGLATVDQAHYLGYETESPSCPGKHVSSQSSLANDGLHSAVQEAPSSGNRHFGLTGFVKLASNRYWPLIDAVVNSGPVAASVSADTWSAYASGIFSDCEVDAVVDHAVTLVGYGEEVIVDKTYKYWIIQNSWGHAWGEDGRIRLLRSDTDDQEDHCGTDHHPEVGLGCEGGPDSVCVCGMCGVLYDSIVPVIS